MKRDPHGSHFMLLKKIDYTSSALSSSWATIAFSAFIKGWTYLQGVFVSNVITDSNPTHIMNEVCSLISYYINCDVVYCCFINGFSKSVSSSVSRLWLIPSLLQRQLRISVLVLLLIADLSSSPMIYYCILLVVPVIWSTFRLCWLPLAIWDCCRQLYLLSSPLCY